MVDNILAGLVDFLAPVRCFWCGGSSAGSPACAGCRDALPWNLPACRSCAMPLGSGDPASVCGDCLRDAPPQHGSWAAFCYRPPVAQAIVELKFHGRLAGARTLGCLMAGRLARRALPMPQLLVPMPLHAHRLRRRGYNQALELGRELARTLSVPIAPAAARRVRATLEQTRLDGAARRRNVQGAFAVDPEQVRGRHVALLDDVITTGATAAELVRTTLAAGAARVEVWAAARVT
ncbi:MAG: ComF family protein [Gammaproteobacteria bacterium]